MNEMHSEIQVAKISSQIETRSDQYGYLLLTINILDDFSKIVAFYPSPLKCILFGSIT